MGQQQLLLLVLSTVIVGLATVAGIQAFQQNQAQASQDALVQKGTAIATKIQALVEKPTQMGGIKPGTSLSGADIADRMGYDTHPIPAQGAGNNADCSIATTSSGKNFTVTCDSDNSPQTVTVTVDPDEGQKSDIVTTSFSS